MITEPADWARNLNRVRERIASACDRVGRNPEGIRLLPVTKSLPREALEHLPSLGITEIGENRALEGLVRKEETSASFRWHMIGHLQTNKVKKVLDWADVLHSLDRLSLVEALEKELSRREKSLPCYLQVNVSGEDSKGGFPPEETGDVIRRIRDESKHIELIGLMTMAPAGEEARRHFRRLRDLSGETGLPGLSMGMTQDFETAVEEGADLVRIGSAIFR